jgi:hypothetical protein
MKLRSYWMAAQLVVLSSMELVKLIKCNVDRGIHLPSAFLTINIKYYIILMWFWKLLHARSFFLWAHYYYCILTQVMTTGMKIRTLWVLSYCASGWTFGSAQEWLLFLLLLRICIFKKFSMVTSYRIVEGVTHSLRQDWLASDRQVLNFKKEAIKICQ